MRHRLSVASWSSCVPFREAIVVCMTELEAIAARIRIHEGGLRAERARQRELIRERIRDGRTWDEVQAEAHVSRPTIASALRQSS